MRLLLLLLVLSMMACAETIPLHGSVSLDSRFSPEETEEVLSAAQQWRQATGMVALDISVSDDAESSEFSIVRRDGIGQDRGLTTRTPGKVLIEIWPADIYNMHEYEDGIPGYGSVEQIALHELGHAFGLAHQTQGLMTPGGRDAPRPACIDSYTLSRFCFLYACEDVRPTCPD